MVRDRNCAEGSVLRRCHEDGPEVLVFFPRGKDFASGGKSESWRGTGAGRSYFSNSLRSLLGKSVVMERGGGVKRASCPNFLYPNYPIFIFLLCPLAVPRAGECEANRISSRSFCSRRWRGSRNPARQHDAVGTHHNDNKIETKEKPQ